MPVTDGVPLMVMVFDAHAADTPVGSPVAVPMPVAPVVVCVMLVMAVFTHTVLLPGPVTVLSGVMLIVTILLM